VTDPTGGTAPKATAEVEDTEKGIRRTAVTGSDGEYQVTGLPPSTYSVTVRLAGFQTENSQECSASTLGRRSFWIFACEWRPAQPK